MALGTPQVRSMLRAAFLKTELEFLEAQPRFVSAVSAIKTAADFTRVCEVAEELLKEHSRATAAGRQLRDERKSGPRNPPSS